MRKFTTVALLAAVAAFGTGCMRASQPGKPSADVSADFKKVQGTWAIESFDNGVLDKRTEAEKKRDLEDMQKVRFRFDGNKLLIAEGGREELFATFALDETQNPKVLALTRGGRPEDGPRGTSRGTSYTTARATTAPYTTGRNSTVRSTYRGTNRGDDSPASGDLEKWNWIYKFDGDLLVVAFCRDDRKEKPTEFKPRAETPGMPGVVVITFKRSAAEPVGPGPGGTGRTGTARGTYRGTSK